MSSNPAPGQGTLLSNLTKTLNTVRACGCETCLRWADHIERKLWFLERELENLGAQVLQDCAEELEEIANADGLH